MVFISPIIREVLYGDPLSLGVHQHQRLDERNCGVDVSHDPPCQWIDGCANKIDKGSFSSSV
jgi:hypothetical protein